MKSFIKIILILNLFAFFVLLFIFYFNQKTNEEEIILLKEELSLNKNKLTNLEDQNKIIKEETEKKMLEIDSVLLGLVQQEQKKDESFENELNKILNDVNVLNKLIRTDKELLMKYSKVYFLNEHYTPLSLVEIQKDLRSDTSVNFKILRSVEPYLNNMLLSASNEGFSLKVQSAYRSFYDQMKIKSNNTLVYGTGANKFSADQGYSEHQLGTTVDFTTTNMKGKLSGFDNTPEYTWLLNNAHKYGFVLSYPKGNGYYIFEPWHWRFVGLSLATRLYEEKKNFYDMDQREIDTYLVNLFD